MPSFSAGHRHGRHAGLVSAPAVRVRAHRAAGSRKRAGACSAGHAERLCGAQEWWNAATVSHFWRTWNLPVHHWILRSAHAPALRAGVGKMGAVVACFALSAVLHELAVAVPLRVATTPHAALGMLAQARRCLPPRLPPVH